jgi:threonine/homoserine/homoserine lactone efflux protein
LFAVPFAYDALKFAGAAYLFLLRNQTWLAIGLRRSGLATAFNKTAFPDGTFD